MNVPPLPPRLIGLDPTLNGCFRMFIATVHSLTHYPSIPSIWNLNGHPIDRITISGVVVAVEIKHKFCVFTLDDGTGLLPCVYWTNDPESSVPSINLGDFIDVFGKLDVFRGAKQIKIRDYQRFTDPNIETLRRLQTIANYPTYRLTDDTS